MDDHGRHTVRGKSAFGLRSCGILDCPDSSNSPRQLVDNEIFKTEACMTRSIRVDLASLTIAKQISFSTPDSDLAQHAHVPHLKELGLSLQTKFLNQSIFMTYLAHSRRDHSSLLARVFVSVWHNFDILSLKGP